MKIDFNLVIGMVLGMGLGISTMLLFDKTNTKPLPEKNNQSPAASHCPELTPENYNFFLIDAKRQKSEQTVTELALKQSRIHPEQTNEHLSAKEEEPLTSQTASAQDEIKQSASTHSPSDEPEYKASQELSEAIKELIPEGFQDHLFNPDQENLSEISEIQKLQQQKNLQDLQSFLHEEPDSSWKEEIEYAILLASQEANMPNQFELSSSACRSDSCIISGLQFTEGGTKLFQDNLKFHGVSQQFVTTNIHIGGAKEGDYSEVLIWFSQRNKKQ